MDRMLRHFPIKVLLPVLVGQFLFHWIDEGGAEALRNLPFRACLLFAIGLIWAAYRTRAEWKKRSFH